MRDGHTLFELMAALALGAVLLHLGSRATAGWLDRWAVLGAREQVARLVLEARTRALGTSGASIEVRERDGTVTITDAADSVWAQAVGPQFGVEIEVAGAADLALLRFDALGLGRVASRRLYFHRGRARTELTVSSYGRIRRR